jgi:hypothetical protein
MVCVLPGGSSASVRIATVEDGAIVDETTLTVDGVARAVEDGGCVGSETASWSRDGRRVFLRTELDCSGIRRVSTGVLALVAENEWVDVQAVTVAGQHATRTLRYRAVRPESVPAEILAQLPQDRRLVLEAARLQTSAPLDVDAVVEASHTVAAPVVEALLAARRQGFALNAQRLLELERAGVATSVIDMMIALSYPATFAVQERPRQQTAQGTAAWGAAPASARFGGCRDPYYGTRMTQLECEVLMMQGYGSRSMYGYGYGSGYGYRYSPWGYDPYGWNYGGQAPVVIVRPDDTRERGEVVKGQGYTPGSGGTATGRTARERDTSGSGGSTGSTGGTTTTGTTTSSPPDNSSGTTTGRTAVPRNGGGGGQ